MADTHQLPPMSDEQRALALEKAAAARRKRAEIKALLKTGSLTLAEVFEQAEVDDIVAGTKVYPLLASMPRMGKIKAIRLMEEPPQHLCLTANCSSSPDHQGWGSRV